MYKGNDLLLVIKEPSPKKIIYTNFMGEKFAQMQSSIETSQNNLHQAN